MDFSTDSSLYFSKFDQIKTVKRSQKWKGANSILIKTFVSQTCKSQCWLFRNSIIVVLFPFPHGLSRIVINTHHLTKTPKIFTNCPILKICDLWQKISLFLCGVIIECQWLEDKWRENIAELWQLQWHLFHFVLTFLQFVHWLRVQSSYLEKLDWIAQIKQGLWSLQTYQINRAVSSDIQTASESSETILTLENYYDFPNCHHKSPNYVLLDGPLIVLHLFWAPHF